MNHALYSNGRLLEGGDEKRAIAAVIAIYKISEDQARKVFLSGRRKRITASTDKDKIQRLCDHLRKCGLDVEVEQIAAVQTTDISHPAPKVASSPSKTPAESRPEVASADTADVHNLSSVRRMPKLVFMVAALLMLIGGAVGFGWYWLYVEEPAPLLEAEVALADGNLVAIGYVDVAKAVTLSTLVLGEVDPDALPDAGNNHELVKSLFFGPPQFDNNLRQAMFSVHANSEQTEHNLTLLLAGSFNAETILKEFARDFDVSPIGEGSWSLEKKISATSSSTTCPKDAPLAAKNAKSSPLQLRITPQWLMIATQPRTADDLWRRLESGVKAEQDLTRWRSYRSGKLAAVMAYAPENAARAVGGFPGLIAAAVVKKSPEIQGAAAAVAVDIPAGGLDLGVTLFSDNAEWNRSTVEKMRQSLSTMQADTSSMSPALAQLVARVSAQESGDRVNMNVTLDKGVFREFDQIVGDVIASIFRPTITNANPSQVVQDEVQQQVADYTLYSNLLALPQRPRDDNGQQPLFIDGAFSADLSSIRFREGEGLELTVEGQVQLPAGREFSAPDVETISLQIESVEGPDGADLLSNERCTSPKGIFGPKNHEPVTRFSAFNQRASLTKSVRLSPGISFENISRITGVITFAAPTSVRKFSVPLRAGEAIEHSGMRFYISGVRGNSVSYQISGDSKFLLEVRALNDDGKPLQDDWSTFGKSGGRATRSFRGEIRGLEVYVAERWISEEKHFVLGDLQAMSTKPVRKKPQYYAPSRIEPQAWQQYVKLDFDALETGPKDWMMFGAPPQFVVERRWPALKAQFTHTPAQWGNDPQAHIYFGALPELPAVLSALSYRLDVPAPKQGAHEMFVRVSYPYYTNTGALAIKHQLNGLPVAQQSISLRSGLEENQPLAHLKGEFIVRLPTQTTSTEFPLGELWGGKTTDGITVTLTDIRRGMFPGYALKVEGELDRLVNVHGVALDGQRVIGDPVSFQTGGFWTLTLPFGHRIQTVELVMATEQKIMKFPFDIEP